MHHWAHKRIHESYELGVRVIDVVAVLVLDGVESEKRVLDERKAEIAPVVSLGCGVWPLLEKGGVRMVFVEKYGHTLHLCERGAVAHRAGEHHRVYLAAGGEDIGVACEVVSFIDIRDGICETQGIGGVRLEILLETYVEGLAPELSLRSFRERRGEEDVLAFLDGHILVEGEVKACSGKRNPYHSRQGRDVDDIWRYGVLLATCRGLGRVGAGLGEKERKEDSAKDEYQRDVSFHIKCPCAARSVCLQSSEGRQSYSRESSCP